MTAAGAAPGGVVLSGVEALARLLVLRHELDERDGLRTATMVSGYPGSPLGGFDLTLERLGPQLSAHRIVHRPGLNEELAAATVWGSQMGAAVPYAGVDGVVGAWYGKGPGLDRCGDVLKHANAMGAGPNGGVVAFCGDDPTAKSSTLPCDSQPTFADACIPVLFPADQQDLIDLGVHAFRLSRAAGPWVGVKVVTAVADGIGTVDLSPERHRTGERTGLVVGGQPWVHRPLATIGPHAVADQELLVVERRLAAAKAYVHQHDLDRVIGAADGARVGIVCAGKTYLDVMQALGELGVPPEALAAAGISVLKLAMTYPVVEPTVLAFAASVDELLVIEEKRPFVEGQVRAILHEAASPTRVLGKRDRSGEPLASSVGELDSGAVARILTRVLPELTASRSRNGRSGPMPVSLPVIALPGRAPGFCSGCPHNRSTVFPGDALVGGGVGCHGIMYFEARHAGMKALPPTPMGAEGVPWCGLAPFVAEPHLIQNLGDGTLSHSGTLAIRASVAAGVDVTFKILYNAAVAMTGGQDVTGLMDVPAMTRALHAEGVQAIVVCAQDPKHYGRKAAWAPGVEVLGRDELNAVQERLRAVRGVSVIIYDQRCAAEARRLRKRGLLAEPARRVVINEAVCEGCGDCGAKSNCLSVIPVVTELGEKRQIHEPSCNRDYTCLEGDCPSFVTIEPRRRSRWATAVRPATAAAATAPPPSLPSLPAGELPPPGEIVGGVRAGSFGLYFTGIGGTGVVTANRIVSAAAEAAGYQVQGLDQTGLSQKAGSVVSHLHLLSGEHPAVVAAAVGEAGADLYLSGDLLQAAAPHHLARTVPGHTVAVVDDELTPTAAMLQSGAAAPNAAVLRAAIADRLGSSAAFVPSKRIAEVVLANHLLANVVLLGAAYQLGALPLTLEELDHGIEHTGAAAANRAAFAWGRWAVQEPAAVQERLAAIAGPPADPYEPSASAMAAAEALVRAMPGMRAAPIEVGSLVTRRCAQVVDYQGSALAKRYLALVGRAVAADGDARRWSLTRAVADGWFHVLAYKDEYEVARLHLRSDHGHTAATLGIDGPFTVRYHLHPPVLRRLGLRRKVALGASGQAAFRALAPLKRLRGTPFDPFGRDPDRRLERALIGEYERLVAEQLAGGPSMDYDRAVAVAASAMAVKGYGQIKAAAVERWRATVHELLQPVATGASSTLS